MKRDRADAPTAAAAPPPTAPLPSPYVDPMPERAQKTKDFLASLRLSVPIKRLQESNDRRECPKCHRRRQFYCYDCLCVVHPETHPPPLHLPVSVHVLLHQGEHRSKATTLAASVISPDMHIHSYPEIPTLDAATTVVLYPSEQSRTLQEFDLSTVKAVVFIDSTWQQSKAIARDPRVVGFRHIRIEKRESLFWRFQDKDPSYLATVEAIYYFVRTYCELQAAKRGLQYAGEVDDLLTYYVNQYITIQRNYTDRAFCARHFTDYVLRGVDWDAVVESMSAAAEARQKAAASSTAAVA